MYNGIIKKTMTIGLLALFIGTSAGLSFTENSWHKNCSDPKIICPYENFWIQGSESTCTISDEYFTPIRDRDDQLDQFNYDNDGYGYVIYYEDENSYHWVAQSFKPTMPTLTRIKLLLFRFDDVTPPTFDLFVSIRSTKSGENLTNYTIPYDQVPIYPDMDWIECNITDINVTANEIYYIVCEAYSGNHGGPWSGYAWLFGEQNPYSRGEAWLFHAGDWHLREDTDFCFQTYGQIEGNYPPYMPYDPNPENGATDVSVYTNLSWTGGDLNPEDTVTYDVYFGNISSPSQVASNQSETYYDPGELENSTTYYWKVVAWDDLGASAEGAIWSFTTEANSPPYTPFNPDPEDGTIDVDINTDISWTGGDPNPEDIVTYDVYFGTTSSPPQVVWEQTGTSYDPGTMNYNTQYYWKIVAWDNQNASAEGPIWSFTTEEDEVAPVIELVKPEELCLYITNQKVTPFITTLIIGPIDIEVNASDDQSGIDRIEFYIDDEYKGFDKVEPYYWTWDEKVFFRHTIKVVAYDNAYNSASKELTVWKFF